jgi:ACS family sodium-dependent inorganic phosphate cotransporter
LQHTLLQWRTVFWIAFGVFLLTNLIFICFASGEVQSWNFADDDADEKGQKEMTTKNNQVEKC